MKRVRRISQPNNQICTRSGVNALLIARSGGHDLVRSVLFAVAAIAAFAGTQSQKGDQADDLTAERATNVARIAAIERDGTAVGNELQQVLDAIDEHNRSKPDPRNASAVALFNARSESRASKRAGQNCRSDRGN
jgi:hypothetical protein